jgi:hypothetical protein
MSYTTGKEFSGLIPNGSCGSYTSLANYNQAYSVGANGLSALGVPALASQTLANNNIILPAYGSMGYNSLTHGGQSSCGTYFNRTSAYPGMDAQGNCKTSYIARVCSNPKGY